MSRGPGLFRVAGAVAKVTFREILGDRILYGVLVLAVLFLGLAVLGTQLSFVSPERLIIDFGLAALGVSGALLGIFLGSSSLNREFERRTIQVALSHPIGRGQFLFGKFLGVVLALGVNWLLLGLVFTLVAGLFSVGGFGSFLGRLDGALGAAFFLLYLQGAVLAAVALLFSTYSSTLVSAFVTFGIFLVGSSVTDLGSIASKSESPTLRAVAWTVVRAVPNLEYFNLREKVSYNLPLASGLVPVSVLYALAWMGACLILASFLVRTKDAP